MSRLIKDGQVWYDPKSDVLGIVFTMTNTIAYVQCRFDGDATDFYVPLVLGNWSKDLVYIGTLD